MPRNENASSVARGELGGAMQVTQTKDDEDGRQPKESAEEWDADVADAAGNVGELLESSYRIFSPRRTGIYFERFQALVCTL